MSHPTVLIIGGMHRSGTSLVASILQNLGLNIGNKLVEVDQRNPRGFFEDAEFYEFHQQALRSRHKTPYLKETFIFEPTPAEKVRAQALIDQRSHQERWGWKDPRTCLFLDFWDELIPNAQYLFVYRHPLDVLLSFIRRTEPHTVGLLEALTSWQIYNSKMIAFYQQHRDSCLLCETYSILEQIDSFQRLLQNKLGFELQPDTLDFESLYHPAELRRAPITAEINHILHNIYPPAVDLYNQLDALADLAYRPQEVATGSLSSDLAHFSTFCEKLEPHPPARVRGLLFLLISFLDPKLIESFFEHHGQYIIHMEQGAADLVTNLKTVQDEKKEAWQIIQQLSKEKDEFWDELQRFDKLTAELKQQLDVERHKPLNRIVSKLKNFLTGV